MPDSIDAETVIHVAVGVILREGRVLLARRPDHLHQGGLWEFPGGKVEARESVTAALHRELQEELDISIDVDAVSALIEVRHDYGDRRVCLDVWCVTAFFGTPRGVEGQQLEWVPIAGLDQRAFPAANRPIVEAVQALR